MCMCIRVRHTFTGRGGVPASSRCSVSGAAATPEALPDSSAEPTAADAAGAAASGAALAASCASPMRAFSRSLPACAAALQVPSDEGSLAACQIAADLASAPGGTGTFNICYPWMFGICYLLCSLTMSHTV